MRALRKVPGSRTDAAGASVWRIKLIPPALLALLCVCAFTLTAFAETDEEVAARQQALDLAGAFSNDGFKIRDGHWSGSFAPHEKKLFAVNLYAGNQYWFSAGTPGAAKKLTIEIFNETGAPVTTDKFHADGKAAAGFSAANSGQFFVRIGLEEDAPAAVCLIYSYK